MTFVVARYNESIDWLQPIIKDCIILNKGEPLHVNNETPLENVGRESDSYLWYIIQHYDNLPDVVVFTQANIADHLGSNNVKYLLNMKQEAELYGKSIPRIHNLHVDNEVSCWGPIFNHPINHRSFKIPNTYKHDSIFFIDWFRKNISESYPNPISIYYNAIFAVKKELILAHPKEYYETLRKEVHYDINPMEGHFFERSWYYIFNSPAVKTF